MHSIRRLMRLCQRAVSLVKTRPRNYRCDWVTGKPLATDVGTAGRLTRYYFDMSASNEVPDGAHTGTRRRLLSTTFVGGIATIAFPATSACTAFAPAPAPALADAKIRGPITYVAMGASDAAGVGVEQPSRDGWVPVLGTLLPPATRVVNLGIPGIRLREAAIVETGPTIEAKPNLITIWLVVNDILGSVPLAAYRSDLDALLTRLKSETSAEIAIGNVPDSPDNSGYLGLPATQRRTVANQWNAAISEIVARHQLTLIDLWTKWPVREHPEYIGPDGLHPTVLGYRVLAETVRQALRDAKVV